MKNLEFKNSVELCVLVAGVRLLKPISSLRAAWRLVRNGNWCPDRIFSFSRIQNCRICAITNLGFRIAVPENIF